MLPSAPPAEVGCQPLRGSPPCPHRDVRATAGRENAMAAAASGPGQGRVLVAQLLFDLPFTRMQSVPLIDRIRPLLQFRQPENPGPPKTSSDVVVDLPFLRLLIEDDAHHHAPHPL